MVPFAFICAIVIIFQLLFPVFGLSLPNTRENGFGKVRTTIGANSFMVRP
jgi:Na+/H+ antiporter NhaC